MQALPSNSITIRDLGIECSMCLSLYVDPVIIKCSHIFCSACLAELKPKQCPYCRRVFTDQDVIKNFQLAGSIEKINDLINKTQELERYDPLDLVLHLSAPSNVVLPPKEKPVRHTIPQKDPESGIWSMEIVRRELSLKDLQEEFPEIDRRNFKLILKYLKEDQLINKELFLLAHNGSFICLINGHRDPENTSELIIENIYQGGQRNDAECVKQFMLFLTVFRELHTFSGVNKSISNSDTWIYWEYFQACKFSDAKLELQYTGLNKEMFKITAKFKMTASLSKGFSDIGLPRLPTQQDVTFDYELELEFFICFNKQMSFNDVFSLFSLYSAERFKKNERDQVLCVIICEHPQLESASFFQIITFLEYFESSSLHERLIGIMERNCESSRDELRSLSPENFSALLLKVIKSKHIDFCCQLMDFAQFKECAPDITFYMYIETSVTSKNLAAFRCLIDLPAFKKLGEMSLKECAKVIERNRHLAENYWSDAADLIQQRIDAIEAKTQKRIKKYEARKKDQLVRILQYDKPPEVKNEVVSWYCNIL